MTVEGHALRDVSLSGWAYGPELGTAPVVVIVGGITASPFPLGDDRAPDGETREAWWPSLFAPDLIDPARYTILCPCWPGNGSTWRGFDDVERAGAGDFGARPRRSDGGLARRLRLLDADHVRRREPRRHGRRRRSPCAIRIAAKR